MRTTVDAGLLRDALTMGKRYTGRPDMPVTKVITLRAATSTFYVRRWTPNADANATMHGSTEAPGTVYVDVDALTGAIGKTKGPVTLSAEDGTLTITAGTVTASVPLNDGANVPAPDGNRYGAFAYVWTDEAISLRAVAVAAATGNDARAVLSGVYFDAEDGRAVATDTYRMHGTELRTITKAAIIPAVHVTAVTATATGAIALGITDDGRRYSMDYTVAKGRDAAARVLIFRITAPTIEGPFPNYASLIPAAADAAATWTIADAAAVAAAFVPFHTKTNDPMHVEASAGALRLTRRDRDGGTTEGSAPIDTGTATEGTPTFAINARYLGDAVRMTGDGAALRVRDGMRSIITEGSRTFALVMPMRVN